MESNLITISDIQAYRRIDPKFNADRLNTFIQEVQRTNLRGLLTESVYLDFMNDSRAAGKYKELLDGKDYLYNGYTIHYYGIKPILCYWILAILARESDTFQSNVGAIQFVNNEQQSYQASKEKERIAVQYMETAQGYANDAIKFLNANAATYTLWRSTTEQNRTNILSFKL